MGPKLDPLKTCENRFEARFGARMTHFGGRPGGYRGAVGRIIGGVQSTDSQIGRISERYKKISVEGSSTPFPVGRRIASRIPPGRGSSGLVFDLRKPIRNYIPDP